MTTDTELRAVTLKAKEALENAKHTSAPYDVALSQFQLKQAMLAFRDTFTPEAILILLDRVEKAEGALEPGYVMVPLKATKEMCKAGYDREHDGTTPLYFKIWDAMIAAALPKPESER